MVLQVEYVARVGHGGRPQLGKPTYVEVLKWRDATERDIRGLDWIAGKASPDPIEPQPDAACDWYARHKHIA